MLDVTKGSHTAARTGGAEPGGPQGVWFSVIAQFTHDAIVGKDPLGCVTFWNPAAERLFGYSTDEAMGRRFAELVPPLVAEDDVALHEALARGEVLAEREQVRIGKDGAHLTVSATIAPVRDREGHIMGTALVVRDVSERLRINAQLRHAERLATVGTVAAALVHELSQPLTYLSVSLGRLRRSEGSPVDHALLASAEEGLDTMLNLVRELRSFSRVDQEQSRELELADVIDSALRISAAKAQSGGELVVDCEPNVRVRGDFTRLVQVFINLLVNAVDAVRVRPARERVIRVVVKRGQPLCRVDVSDNGGGIPENALPHLFEPFFTTKPMECGTGLGLAIARQIVVEAGGKIEVDSKVSVGTTFSVYLPCAE